MLYDVLQKILARPEYRTLNPDTDTTPSPYHEYNYHISKRYIKNKRLLDIGCWSGQFERLAVRSTKDIIGLDCNEEAILFARRLVKGPTFVVGSATKLSFKNESFDVVTFFDVLEHIPASTERVCLKEIHRVLKSGGYLLLCTPYKHLLSVLLDPSFWSQGHRHYGKQELMSLFSKAGFRIVDIFTVGGIWNALSYIAEMTLKHIFKVKPRLPAWVRQKVKSEYARNAGPSGIRITAQKI